MGRSARQLISLTLACAFSSCFAEVALGVELSPETTSFHQVATSTQPLSFYRSSPHQSTTVPFNSTGPLQTTPVSQRTTEQTAEQLQATSAPGQHGAAQAGADTVSTAPTDSPGTARQATTSVTAAVKNTTTPSVSSTSRQRRSHVTTGTTAVATNSSLKQETENTQGTAATTGSHRAGPSTRSRRQTIATGSPTTTAVNTTTTTHAGTRTSPTSPASTVRPRPTPQPPGIPTGTYSLSDGNGTGTCVKAVMGLQLMARNIEQGQMEYVTVNPNMTKISGSCGMVQSQLNLTFNGGFVNITFVKQAPSYSVTRIESRIQLSSEGMLFYAALNEKLFTTKLGNSFKCASRQTFLLERDFQILFVHMQLQAFDIVGDQFGKEEECSADRNSKVAPIAVCLTILGLFVIVFATFLISRRKPHRGYERI